MCLHVFACVFYVRFTCMPVCNVCVFFKFLCIHRSDPLRKNKNKKKKNKLKNLKLKITDSSNKSNKSENKKNKKKIESKLRLIGKMSLETVVESNSSNHSNNNNSNTHRDKAKANEHENENEKADEEEDEEEEDSDEDEDETEEDESENDDGGEEEKDEDEMKSDMPYKKLMAAAHLGLIENKLQFNAQRNINKQRHFSDIRFTSPFKSLNCERGANARTAPRG